MSKLTHLRYFREYVETPTFSGRYITIKLEPNFLQINLTDEGKSELSEKTTEGEVLHEDLFFDLFEDIKANSSLEFSLDIGTDFNAGLTEAPGFSYEDDIYYYNDYMIKSFVEELYNNGEVFFDKK